VTISLPDNFPNLGLVTLVCCITILDPGPGSLMLSPPPVSVFSISYWLILSQKLYGVNIVLRFLMRPFKATASAIQTNFKTLGLRRPKRFFANREPAEPAGYRCLLVFATPMSNKYNHASLNNSDSDYGPCTTSGRCPRFSLAYLLTFDQTKLPPGANRILFVKNLNYQITGDDLYDLFGRYGSIRQIRIGNEQKTKGTAFVVFEDVMDVCPLDTSYP
jgi:hypothetical protein